MVEGYQGRPGAGKTLTMVVRAHQAKEMGRPVYANIPLIDNRQRQRRRHFFFGEKYSEPCNAVTFGKSWADGPVLQTIEETVTLDNALVLLDEVHMWLPSTAWTEISFEVRRMLAQQRKDGLDIWWTAQSNARVFNVIRELTATLWSCQRYGPVIVMAGLDPESKEGYGRRYVKVKPSHYDLYNTRYKVGDGKDSEGGLGVTKRYDRSPEGPSGSDRKRIPLPAMLDREEASGLVRYRKDGDAARWWQEREMGAAVGPSPLVVPGRG